MELHRDWHGSFLPQKCDPKPRPNKHLKVAKSRPRRTLARDPGCPSDPGTLPGHILVTFEARDTVFTWFRAAKPSFPLVWLQKTHRFLSQTKESEGLHGAKPCKYRGTARPRGAIFSGFRGRCIVFTGFRAAEPSCS